MKKTLIYSGAVVVPGIAVGLILALAAHMNVVLAVFLGLFASLCGAEVCRIIMHAVYRDWSDSFIASAIWQTVAVGLFAWLCFNTSEAIQTMLVFGIITAAINSIGFRFIAQPREEAIEPKAVAVKEPSRKEKIAELVETLRYKFMPDGVTPNLDAPLCVDEDGHHLTPSEADKKGLGAMYAEAVEYIKTIV